MTAHLNDRFAPRAVGDAASLLTDIDGWLTATALASVVAAGTAVIAVLLVVRVVVRRARHRRLLAGARLMTVLAPPRVDPHGAAALWGHLAGLARPRWRRLLFGQPHLCFEYLITPHGAVVRIWVPGPVPPGLVERAVAAAWPGATTRTTPAPTTPGPATPARAESAAGPWWRAVTTGGVLRLARAGGLPISDDPAGDPVAALLAAPGDLQPDNQPAGDCRPAPGDRVIVQVLARPAATAHRASRASVPVGSGLVGGIGAIVVWAAREILTLITPGGLTALHPAGRGLPSNARSGVDRRARLAQSSGDRAAVTKIRGPAFETLVRYAATTHIPHPPPDPDAARAQLRAAQRLVRGRAHGVAAVFASFAGHNYYRRRRLSHPDQAIAARWLARGDLLSVSELAAIAALPTAEHIPGLIRAGARSVAPPPGIPAPGPDVKPLGDTTTSTTPGSPPTGPTSAAGTATGSVRWGRPVGMRVADARHHLHVIGATGSGKSTLLVQLILADIRAHRGVVVIDPKGDLVTDVLHRLPPPVRARAMVIDPDQPGPPPCLNPLNPTLGHQVLESDIAVENLVSIFRRVFSAYWGPRVDDLMRAACLTLYTQPGRRSLADLPPLLTDPDVRARHMRAVHDPLLREFWDSYDRLSDPVRAQVVAPLMNKVRALLLRPFTRAVLTGPRPTPDPSRTAQARPLTTDPMVGEVNVDMPAVLDGGILLARLPKGSLGDEGTRLVGSIVVAHAWAAATARAGIPQQQRRDAALVIDECHNFLNLPYGITEILAEARGLRLSLTLAHQNLAQLPRDLREGISSNARNKIFFTVGPDDARDLARHTLPQLGEHDLAHLDAFHAAARLVCHDAETPAFTLHTRPLAPPRRAIARRAEDRANDTPAGPAGPTPP